MGLQNFKNNYDKLKCKCNLSGEKAIKAVENNGYALRYVKKQTEAICLKAVENNGDALQYVKKQTEAICLKAVENNGYALRFVQEYMFDK